MPKKAPAKAAPESTSAAKSTKPKPPTKRKAAIVRDPATGQLRGRACTITPQIIADARVKVAQGAHPRSALVALGVISWTADIWLRKGREDLAAVHEGGEVTLYAALVYELERAEAESINEQAKNLAEPRMNERGIDPAGVKAATLFLEKRDAERWGRTIRHEVRVEATKALLDMLRTRLPAATFMEVLDALQGPDDAPVIVPAITAEVTPVH